MKVRKIKSYVKNLFIDSREEERELRIHLQDLLCGTKVAKLRNDPLLGVVDLYASVAEFEDKDILSYIIKKIDSINYGQRKELLAKISTLQHQVKILGRDLENGPNKTKIGELVTDETIWLGGYSGLEYMTVKDWIAKSPKEPEVINAAKLIIHNHGAQLRTTIMEIMRLTD